MQIFNKNLKVHKGETFSLQFKICTETKEPYIISSAFTNPYLLLSVSDTMHYEEGKYVKNYWLSLANVPKFELTRPFNIKDLKTSAVDNVSKYESFDGIETDFKSPEGKISGYVNGVLVNILPSYAVFYNKNEGYKYWNGTTLVNYDFKFVKTFTSADTNEWVSQNYYYDLQLVEGVDTLSYLRGIAREMNIPYENYNIIELYNILLDNDVKFSKGFSVNQPIGKIDLSFPILSNGKIQVINYVQGGVTWTT